MKTVLIVSYLIDNRYVLLNLFSKNKIHPSVSRTLILSQTKIIKIIS